MSPTNSLFATAVICASLAALAAPALAEPGDYLSRRDSIWLSAGDAPRANLAIQTPTPWPRYVNKRRIPGYGPRMLNVIEKLNSLPAEAAAPATTINIGGFGPAANQ